MQMRNASSALSAASSACDHIRNWVLGTPKDEWVSMAVFSDGSYGAPKASRLRETNDAKDLQDRNRVLQKLKQSEQWLDSKLGIELVLYFMAAALHGFKKNY